MLQKKLFNINEYACATVPVITRTVKEIINAWVLFDVGPSELCLCLGSNNGNVNNVMAGSIFLLIHLQGGIFKKYYIEHQYVRKGANSLATVDLKALLEDKGYKVDETLLTMEDIFQDQYEIEYCQEYKHFYVFNQGGIAIESRECFYCLIDKYGEKKNISVYLNGANTKYIDVMSKTDINLLGFSIETYAYINIEKIIRVLNADEEKLSIDKDMLELIIKNQVPRADLKLIFEQNYELQYDKKHVLFLISFVKDNVEMHEKLLEYTTKNLFKVKAKLGILQPEVDKYIEEEELS